MIGIVRRAHVSRVFKVGAVAGDQAVSSASNFFALLVIARAMTVEEFGVFSLGYAALTLMLGCSRAYLGTHVSLQKDAGDARAAGDAALGALVALTLPLAVFSGLYVLVVAGDTHGRTALVIAIAAPIVCSQDVTRFIAMACGRPRVALCSDATWLVPVVLVYVLGLDLSSTWVLVVWGGSAAVALIVGIALLRPHPDIRAGLQMLRRPRSIIGAQMAGVVAVTGSSLLMLSLVSIIAHASVLGAIRSASVLFGPLNALYAIVPLAVAPLIYRNPRFGGVRFQLALTGAIQVIVLVYGSILAVLPNEVGEALLGKVWLYARPILPATTIEYGSVGAVGVIILALATSLRARQLAVVTISQGALTILFPVAAALLFDSAFAVAVGLAVAGWSAFTIGILVQRATPAPARPVPELVAHPVR